MHWELRNLRAESLELVVISQGSVSDVGASFREPKAWFHTVMPALPGGDASLSPGVGLQCAEVQGLSVV